MRTLKSKVTGATGITVGRRKDGSVAVMYDHNDEIFWFEAELFASFFTEV